MKPFDKYIFFLIAGFILLLISSCYEPDVEEVLRPGAVIQDDKYYLGTSLSYASYLERNATDGQYFKNENGERESPFESVKKHGGNIVRLSVAFGPYTSDKAGNVSYAIDYHVFERVKEDFKKAKDAGLEVFLSILYEKGLKSEEWLKIPDGPEMEDDWHVFSSMNFAEDHPARDMQDTFFIENDTENVSHSIILRTHTSSVQSRVMETTQPPIRVLCPGRVYRNEAISYRAHAFFHQVEALYVDRNVSFTDLKQALLLFAQEMFGSDTKIRLRPSYFPFTEPSAEMDISCNICGGKGCPFCKHTGWVEILGCGMVDPNVLELNGIDSKVYSGYALGMGIERITNLKYQVKDLRMFSENDTRFLKEFESAY